MQLTHTPIDDTRQELTNHGSSDFPFAYYHDVIDQYDIHSVDWHWHPEVELAYLESASICYHIDGRELTLSRGEGLFINSNVLHRLTTKTGGTAHDFVFSAEFVAPSGTRIYRDFVEPVIASGIPFVRIDNPACIERLEALHRAQASNSSTRDLDIHMCVEGIWRELYCTVRALGAKAAPSLQADLAGRRMQLMLAHIQAHFGEPLTLGDIAAAAQLSKSGALRCFRAVLGTTPIAYLAEYRLGKAADLLSRGDMSVAAIARQTGFESTSYFCRMFKRKFGMTPLQFRSERTQRNR